MTLALYAGTFDPVTRGHINVMQRAIGMNPTMSLHVIVALSAKKTLFTIEERVQMIEDDINCTDNFSAYDMKRIKVVAFNGLIVKYAEANNATIMVRGVRNSVDFEYERQLFEINKQLSNKIDTILLPTEHALSTVSSSAVKELASFNAPIHNMVSNRVAEKVYSRLKPGGP